MFTSQVDMKMVLEINKSLRDHHMLSEVHTYSGCATCGLRLMRKNNEDINMILDIIQDYLDTKWMKRCFILILSLNNISSSIEYEMY